LQIYEFFFQNLARGEAELKMQLKEEIMNTLEKGSVSGRGGGRRKGGRTPQLAYHKDYVLLLRQQKEVLMQVVK
jgi:hypothetical protein